MRCLFTVILIIFSNLISKTVCIADSKQFDTGSLIPRDSVLFKRGARYYINFDLLKGTPENIYFGSYGDTDLPEPVLDGSRHSFEFDAGTWTDHEIINGEKFHIKYIPGLKEAENLYEGTRTLTPAREPDKDETQVKGRKNSFLGYFMIDSVSSAKPKKIFFDRRNAADWSGAEAVIKTQQWSYEKRKILRSGPETELEDGTDYPLRAKWGYFIQKHKSALDKKGEWYYDETEGVLYFSPLLSKSVIYLSVNEEEHNSGFDLRGVRKITIENIRFEHFKYGIRLEGCSDIRISNCSFRHCTYGIANQKTYLERISIENCRFTDLHSYGIRLIGNNSDIEKNYIDSVGLEMTSESRMLDNLNGIESYGVNSRIISNTIKNAGYCAIRIYNCAGTKVIGNIIENTNLTVADGGAIYSYHSDKGNKLIRKNTVKNAVGNVSGTEGDEFHASGIYLDEMSLNFRIDSNYVSDCGDGIYIQNSRSDTVVFNRTLRNRKSELHINHAGSILNGGGLNPGNDPSFDPEDLKDIPSVYLWDRSGKVLYYKDGRHNRPVYIEPGNNLIDNNVFVPDAALYTVTLRTWRDISNGTVEELTGVKDFFLRNIPDTLVSRSSLLIVGGNVKDIGKGGKNFDVLKNSLDVKIFDHIRKIYVYIGRGLKYPVEK